MSVREIEQGVPILWPLGMASRAPVNALTALGIGGSRTTPGRFGAQASGLMQTLKDENHKDVKLTDDERRRITLWLDLNSNEIGWAGNDPAPIAAQKKGEALWPPVDVDPENPTGVEKDVPLAGR